LDVVRLSADRGLGFSAMAQRFAIESRGEAVAYLAHDVLGPRLIECTRLVMALSERTIGDILGSAKAQSTREIERVPADECPALRRRQRTAEQRSVERTAITAEVGGSPIPPTHLSSP
jgi:hypothetical protein